MQLSKLCLATKKFLSAMVITTTVLSTTPIQKINLKGASCIIKMWMLKIENTSEYNKTTDWQVSKNLIIQRGIYNEV